MNKNEIKKIILEEIKAVLSEMGPDVGSPEEIVADARPEEGDDDEYYSPDYEDYSPNSELGPNPSFVEEDLDEGRDPNIFKLSRNADVNQVRQFMQRVNNVLKTYKSPGQKRSKRRFTPEEMDALADVMVKPEGFHSGDIINASLFKQRSQANDFLKALEMKGLITLVSVLKKSQKPTQNPNAGKPAKPDEFGTSDMNLGDFKKNYGDFEDLDLSAFDDIYENKTMPNLEKYIRKQIREAKSPLASKMKEVETRGKIAALETKLAAVAEMIEETQGRLTRIDEDEEFTEMMDRNAVKGVRKQLKELERIQAKLQKEYNKTAGGRQKETVVGEVSDDDIPENPNDPKDHPALPESKKSKMEKQLKENTNPAVIDFLRKYVPEEAPGSWDDVNDEFVVPYNHEELGYSEVDVQDFLYDTDLTTADLPTEYVEIDVYSVGDQNRPITARNFAKYVPGEGLYYKMTTEPGNGGGLNESILRMQKLAGILKG